MFKLLGSEYLLYGGFAAMAVAVVLAGIAIGLFFIRGRRLKKTLEHEYGKPRH